MVPEARYFMPDAPKDTNSSIQVTSTPTLPGGEFTGLPLAINNVQNMDNAEVPIVTWDHILPCFVVILAIF